MLKDLIYNNPYCYKKKGWVIMKFRRYLASVMALIMVACSIPFSSAATDNVTAEGFEYAINVESCTVEITGYEGNSDVIYIPAEIEGYPVTSIGSNAFSYNSDISILNVPDSVTYIGDHAFYCCRNLMILELPDSIEAMGIAPFSKIGYTESGKPYVNGVFYYGDYLLEANESVSGHCVVKDGTRVIAGEAFYGCTYLTGITIPDDTTYIGERCFKNCNNFEAITIESGNPVYHSAGNCIIETETKTLVLGSCNSEIPADGSVTSIGKEAFAYLAAPKAIIGSEGLISISIPEGITKIGDDAFYGCYYLESVTLPNSLVEVGTHVFADCRSLDNVVIPDKMKYIPARMFAFCESLSDFTLSSSVTRIEEGAFIGCDSLEGLKFKGWKEQWKAITIEENNDALVDIYFDVTYIPEEQKTTDTGFTYVLDRAREGVVIVAYTGTAKSVSVPVNIEGYPVIKIDDKAFYNNDYVVSVVLPYKLSEIGSEAFYSCSQLTTINIPSNVKKIEFATFQFCAKLEKIILPSAMEEIDTWAFSGCGSLASVVWPDNLKTIEQGAFERTGLVEVILPESVASIRDSAFSFCKSLVKVELPDNITVIYSSMFRGCESLAEVKLPQSLVRIDGMAFKECLSLSHIDLPDTLKRIESYAFAQTGLAEIIVPRNIKYLYKSFVDDCEDLEHVIFNGTEKQWNALEDPYSTVLNKEVIFKGIYGDIDGDYEITSADALIMRRHLAAAEFNDNVNELIADMNDDGAINAKDMLAIKKILAA